MRQQAVAVVVATLAAVLLGGGPAALEPGGSLLSRAEHEIARREYRATPNAVGLQAPNRANGLRTYFAANGVRVHDRTAAGAPRLVELTLSGVGRGEALAPVPAGEVVHDGARVEIRRAGLVEWYENKPEGLEQGFTLSDRPSGSDALELELILAGAALTLADEAVIVQSNSGRRLRYGELRAEDADGNALHARLELHTSDRVRLIIDDSRARYPITIDPLLSAIADAQLEANQDSASLGYTVASAGDVNGDGYSDVIVGALLYDDGQSNEGAAFVFLGSATGIPSGGPATVHAELQGNQANGWFGVSVASAGDVNGDGYSDVIVGAQYFEDGELREGGAFIFTGSALGIADGDPSSAATVLQSNRASTGSPPDALFGGSVASAGDVNGDGYDDVIVGSWGYNNNAGAAFVFLGSASGVADGNPATAATQLDAASPGTFFGQSVDSAGDVNGDGFGDVIAGDAGAGGGSGAAYVFLGSAAGIPDATTAMAQTQIVGGTSQGVVNLGTSVASAGDVDGDGYADVIIGALQSAFVFRGGATGIPGGSFAAATTRLDGGPWTADFGDRVASVGDVNGDGYADVVVGDPGYGNGQANEGAAFVFLGAAGGIPNGTTANAAAQLEINQASAAGLGVSVAAAGDINGDGYGDVIVGAPGYESAGNTNEGAAFLYLGSGSGLHDSTVATAGGKLESNQGTAQLGTSVASAGDVNGDGYGDVIVGAPFYDAGLADEGVVFVFHGGATGIPLGNQVNANATLESDQANAQLGGSVASAGDVNGDGYSDVIVGARFYDAVETDEGAAFVFLGGAAGVVSGSPTSAHARFEADQTNAQLGASVASAGDVNGDGRTDVIVGAPFYDLPDPDEGAAFVFLAGAAGLANGTPLNASATIQSNQALARLGSSVSSAGDMNGDGFGDAIIGAPLFNNGPSSDAGLALVFRGSASGIPSGSPSNAQTRIDSSQASAQLGASVAAAGDVNGDGFGDLIFGAPFFGFGGAGFIVHGSAAPPAILSLSQVALLTELDAAIVTTRLGSGVASAGDVNGDGYGDVILGGPFFPATTPANGGAAWLFYGRASGIPDGDTTSAAAQLDSDQGTARFGTSVGSAGDVNGDGFSDVVIGGPLFDAPQGDEGVAYLFYGGERNGRPVLARQRRGDGSGALVQRWGDAARGDGFVAEITGTHPDGRGRLRAQAEACPVGVAFGGPGCVSGTTPNWVAVSQAAPSAVLDVTLAGLPPSKLLHWRARVLYADDLGPPAPMPAHGPWRLLQAQAVEGTVRTSADADLDGVADALDNCRYRTNPGQEDAGGFGSASALDGIGDVCQCGNVFGGGRVEADDVLAYRQALANPSGAPLSSAAQTRCVVLGTGSACDILQISAIRRGLQVPPLAPITSSSVAQVCAAALP